MPNRGLDSLLTTDLPADDLEIDESFIDARGEDTANNSIMSLIVDFAHTLGLTVTTKRVENDQQVANLMAMGCDMVQGFYSSRPLSTEAVRALVATNPSW